MKIAILSPFHPFRGGIAQVNMRLYPELLKRNEVKAFNFTTLYPDFLFPGKTQLVPEDDAVSAIDANRVLSSVNPLSYIRTAHIIDEYAPDILIIPYWMSFLAPVFGVVSRLVNKKTKVVALVHNAIPHERRFFDKPFAKFFFNKCDAFIVLSESVKKDLELLVPNKKILLTPHPIYDHYKDKIDRDEACDFLKIASNKKNILFFGLIRDYKGLDLLIESMSFLDESYQLIIAGECYGDFSKYQDLINKSPLRDSIKVFEQYIPDEMVTTLFSATDVLVLPYKSATQSGVLAVAYQLETPSVVTNVGALGDAIQSAKTGLSVEEVAPRSIAKGIETFFKEVDKQPEYLANIRQEKKRLSWAHMGDTLQTFFDDLI